MHRRCDISIQVVHHVTKPESRDASVETNGKKGKVEAWKEPDVEMKEVKEHLGQKEKQSADQ